MTSHNEDPKLSIIIPCYNASKTIEYIVDKIKQIDIDLFQDADLECDLNDYPILLEPIINNNADVVYGSCFMGSNTHKVLYFWHYVSISILCNISIMK